MLGIPDSVMPHVRRFGFSGATALSVVVVMIFGINPVTVLTGQVAEPLPHTTLTALEAIKAGEGTPEDLVGAVEREANGFWERAFRSAAVYYPPVALKMVPSSRELGCGMAGSDVGTFYCPDDSTVYVDMTRYADLVSAFPEQGHKAEGYLIGLAYGHHVLAAVKAYDELAALDAAARPALEQQIGARAACYAGAWTKWAGLEELLDDPAMVSAIDSVGTGNDVAVMPSRPAVPRALTPPSADFRKLGFDLGYGIPAAGSCRPEKVVEPI
ncbi:neutral zinc metallopeptidase [Devosia sp. SL43]|uniref:neutral zinc metallopeptidase n=1 Tax=Devosia sp. SL43 TaxID=2806348 RepID=UPI001F1C8271|nr:neutral zinc metallopeptidase [Devosia sp. SL43]UJW86958.1 neutral zinc metallopeptidase [Devosia sp. SL43]